MVGPPGTGKTMLAESLVELLPDLTQEQALEVAAIYSAFGNPREYTSGRLTTASSFHQ